MGRCSKERETEREKSRAREDKRREENKRAEAGCDSTHPLLLLLLLLLSLQLLLLGLQALLGLLLLLSLACLLLTDGWDRRHRHYHIITPHKRQTHNSSGEARRNKECRKPSRVQSLGVLRKAQDSPPAVPTDRTSTDQSKSIARHPKVSIPYL